MIFLLILIINKKCYILGRKNFITHVIQVCNNKCREYVEHNKDHTFIPSMEYQSLEEILVLPFSHILYENY